MSTEHPEAAGLIRAALDIAFDYSVQALKEATAMYGGFPEGGLGRHIRRAREELDLIQQARAHFALSAEPAPPPQEPMAELIERKLAGENVTIAIRDRVEAYADNYVAWARYTDDGRIALCDSDSDGAFRVYRHMPPQEPKPQAAANVLPEPRRDPITNPHNWFPALHAIVEVWKDAANYKPGTLDKMIESASRDIDESQALFGAERSAPTSPPEPAAARDSGAVLGATPLQMDHCVREAIKEAYGQLWHINAEPMAPVPMRSPEAAAHAARKALLNLLTKEERGDAIQAVRKRLEGAAPPHPTAGGSGEAA